MLMVEGLTKVFFPGTVNEKTALDAVSLTLKPGDFVSVIGGNGAGKSTLLNCIAGVFPVDRGHIVLDNISVDRMPEYKRARFMGRVFQDPTRGTAADMEIQENLALAFRRGQRRGLKWGITQDEKAQYQSMLASLDLGLESRMTAKAGLLSGGQRQALTLLMATMNKPRLLLLDEHTAALDPKTARKVMALTDKVIADNGLTTLMITHNMRDALAFGNRLIMMNEGRIVVDIKGSEKKNLKVEDLLKLFESSAGGEGPSDRMLLG